MSDLQSPAQAAPESGPQLSAAHAAELESLLERIRTDFEVDFEPLHVDENPLEVLSIQNMSAHLDKLLQRKAIHDPLKDLPLWAKLWPGSFVLGRLLRKYEPQGKSLLELGAGCGALSLVAARYGFERVVLSDVVEQALRFARANVLRNGLGDQIEVTHVDVTAPGRDPRFASGFDIIAASEILYLDDLHRPLVKFVDRHLAPGGKAFFCTDVARAKPHFGKMAAKTFKITEQNGKYILAINGKTDSRFLFDVKEPTYSFGDGKNYGVTWDILQSELVEKYGGYLVLRHAEDPDGKPRRYLDYLQAITDKNTQTVAFGTNLLDLTNNVKAEDIYTRVIAVGAKKITWLVFSWGETITETANDLAAQKLFGIITKVIFIEGIESTPQSLLDAAEEELAKNLRYLNGMTVKAVDLKDADIDVSRIALGKQTHIFSAPHGVDTWLLCSKLVEPLDSPDKKEFTFGTEFSSISDLQALSARKASDAYDLSRSLKGYMSG